MSREKQIEDLANILWHIPCGYSLNSYNDCEMIAECIYDDWDYRKQSEGEWLEIDDGVLIGDGKHLECSKCGVWKKDKQKSNFCSNCGAKMKGGAE